MNEKNIFPFDKDFSPFTKDNFPFEQDITPRIIIHGGAGNLTKQSLPREKYDAYQASLRRILASSAELLSQTGSTALDVATFAVSLLEDDPLYNSGRGAVFTREGKNELECSIMVSNGYRKRGVGCMMLQHVKNPIKLARELLIRGEKNGGDGSQDHCQYAGPFVEGLAKKWGLDIVDPSHFFTQQRWDEHVRGLEEEEKQRAAGISVNEMSDWEKASYIPLGTCGAVVLDSFGTICVATSTGGLTNKLPGRIGDTPTIGAGFWAEEWHQKLVIPRAGERRQPSPMDQISRGDFRDLLSDCMPMFVTGASGAGPSRVLDQVRDRLSSIRHAVGMSGTGNGDSFLRMNACRTAAANSRFGGTELADAVTWMAGPNGELQKSARDRWGHSHEGTGGIIGIELVGNKGTVVWDFNCGGMFRAWVDDKGKHHCLIFREGYDSGAETFAG
ncbi:N-terminal nucleophile aminohydrolase [Bimuria novae-zelandiae CBS 107.79]|uniref:N-terminal nucleophile aminohydrolase n=1 Tax=Bimuria novae-zelandiae CBS 107.79 TaxID=1447943 RepID=A0A6A5UPD2_9PLEO|nr:N-terminal nucleophile aminohydrolase [Bimuria novae-zelandiae CBS 107.79]